MDLAQVDLAIETLHDVILPDGRMGSVSETFADGHGVMVAVVSGYSNDGPWQFTVPVRYIEPGRDLAAAYARTRGVG